MLKFQKAFEILVSLQIIIITNMIPVFITIPVRDRIINSYEIPITWQIPSIIIISLIFKSEIVFKAFSLYLFLGLFLIPIFQNGGSLGYLLTPNFGYLLGIYPLIKIINEFKKKNRNLGYLEFIKFGIFGISTMHIIGILYSGLQMLYLKKIDIFLYNISSYSLGKYGYHLLMLTPITLLIKPINNNRKS